ncbi:MAG: D-glycero-beta-D-manno-heptose-7-phosphate kinase [Thermodesulfobacteriota bacterium]
MSSRAAPAPELAAAVARFPQARILVVGDVIVDHFIWGQVSRISPEAPVPVVNVRRESLLLGGAANVLHNIRALGGQACLCGVVGSDPAGDRLFELLDAIDAPATAILRHPDRPTSIKTRVIAHHQQVVRFDRETCADLDPASAAALLAMIGHALGQVQVVIVSDYGKGVVTGDLMAGLVPMARAKGIPVVVDPKPQHRDLFAGVGLITPNQLEAERMAGLPVDSEADLVAAAQGLRERLACEAVLVTRGEAGMTLVERDRPALTIPTQAREVFDVTGAGDTVIATLALGLAAGLPLAAAAALANVAAGIVVGKLGTATTSPQELTAALAAAGAGDPGAP